MERSFDPSFVAAGYAAGEEMGGHLFWALHSSRINEQVLLVHLDHGARVSLHDLLANRTVDDVAGDGSPLPVWRAGVVRRILQEQRPSRDPYLLTVAASNQRGRDPEVVRLLLEYGVPATHRTLTEALCFPASSFDNARTLLGAGVDPFADPWALVACTTGSSLVVPLVRHLREHGFDLNRIFFGVPGLVGVWRPDEERGPTLLHMATVLCDPIWFSALLNEGASLEVRDRAGYTPLDLVVALERVATRTGKRRKRSEPLMRELQEAASRVRRAYPEIVGNLDRMFECGRVHRARVATEQVLPTILQSNVPAVVRLVASFL